MAKNEELGFESVRFEIRKLWEIQILSFYLPLLQGYWLDWIFESRVQVVILEWKSGNHNPKTNSLKTIQSLYENIFNFTWTSSATRARKWCFLHASNVTLIAALETNPCLLDRTPTAEHCLLLLSMIIWAQWKHCSSVLPLCRTTVDVAETELERRDITTISFNLGLHYSKDQGREQLHPELLSYLVVTYWIP